MATQAVQVPPSRLRLKCATHRYPAKVVLKQQVFTLSADYRGRKLELDMSDPSMEVYTITALKSKVAEIPQV